MANQAYGSIDGKIFYDAQSYYAYLLNRNREGMDWDDEKDDSKYNINNPKYKENVEGAIKEGLDYHKDVLKKKRRQRAFEILSGAAGVALVAAGAAVFPIGIPLMAASVAGSIAVGGSVTSAAYHWKDIVGRNPEIMEAKFVLKQDKLQKEINRKFELKNHYKEHEKENIKQEVLNEYDQELSKLVNEKLKNIQTFTAKTVSEHIKQMAHLHPKARAGFMGQLDKIRQAGNSLAVTLGYEGFEQKGIKKISAYETNFVLAAQNAYEVLEFARENGIKLDPKIEKEAEKILEEAKKQFGAEFKTEEKKEEKKQEETKDQTDEQENEQTDENKKEDEKTLETGLSKYLFSDENDLSVYDFVLKNDIPIEALKNEDKFKEFLTQSVGLEQEHVDKWFAEYMLVVELAFSQKYEKDSPEFKAFDEALKEWRNPEQKFGYSQVIKGIILNDGIDFDEKTNDALSFINFNNIEITQEQIDKIESEEIKEQVQLYYDLTTEKKSKFMYSIPSSNKDYEYVDSRSLKAAQYLLDLQEKCKNENLDFDEEYKKSPVIIRKVIQDRFVNDPKFSGLVVTLGMGKELYPVPTQKDLTGSGRLTIAYQDKLVDLWKTNESVKVEKNKQKEISNILTSLDSMININDLQEEYVNDVNKFSKEVIDLIGESSDKQKELFGNKAFLTALEAYNKEHADNPYYLWNMTDEEIEEIQKLVNEKAKEESEEKKPNEVNEEDTKKAVEDLEPQYYEVDDSWKEWIDAYNQEQLEKPENERFIIDPMKFDEKAYSEILSYVKNSQKEATAANEDEQTNTSPAPEKQTKKPKKEPKPKKKKQEKTKEGSNGVLNTEDVALKAMVNRYDDVLKANRDKNIVDKSKRYLKKKIDKMTKEEFLDVVKIAYENAFENDSMDKFDNKLAPWIENYNLNHKDAPLSLKNITEEQFIELAFYSVYGPEKTKENEKKATGLMDKNEPRTVNGKIETQVKTSEPTNEQTNTAQKTPEEAEQEENVIETKDYSKDKIISRTFRDYKSVNNETKLDIHSLTQEDYEMLVNLAFEFGMQQTGKHKGFKNAIVQHWIKEYNKDKPREEWFDVNEMSLEDFKKLADEITKGETVSAKKIEEEKTATPVENPTNETPEPAKEQVETDIAQEKTVENKTPKDEYSKKFEELWADPKAKMFDNIPRGSYYSLDDFVGAREITTKVGVNVKNDSSMEDLKSLNEVEHYKDGKLIHPNETVTTLDKIEKEPTSKEQQAFVEAQLEKQKKDIEDLNKNETKENAATASINKTNDQGMVNG